MIIMSVDLGDARTGIAVSDIGEGFAFPRTVINEWNKDKLIEKILLEAQNAGAEKIVVGLPKNMDGSFGFKAQECTELAEKIRSGFKNGEVVMWDERCTTVSAHHALNATNTRGKKRKAIVDAVAATMILEDYLRSIK
ncbi:MAG: Holliday junction resolvase RuvX [Ruminococcaceae bacterium]|nr:Holliday junction resolvase RuvX [Oscillospiraceae bacterium]